MKVFVTTCAVVGALTLVSAPASAQNQQSAYCHNQALAQANAQTSTVGGGVVGGVLGALGGVVAGGILGQGDKAKIAGGVIGGTAGAAIGAGSQKNKREQVYQQAYSACMSQAYPVNYTVPPVGSPEWTYQCNQKYKSFIADPASPAYGTYQPFRDANGALPPRRLCELP